MLKYSIISSRPKTLKEKNLLDKVYKLWRSQWESLLGSKFNSDDFFRQDVISVLSDDLNVVAILLHTNFDSTLESNRGHSYFKDFPNGFFEKMDNLGYKKFSTIESLTIHPDFRHINLSQILCQLTLSLVDYFPSECSIGPTIKAHGVSKMVQTAGALVAMESVKYKGLECDILYGPHQTRNPLKNQEANEQYEKLWSARNDYTGLTEREEDSIAVAN